MADAAPHADIGFGPSMLPVTTLPANVAPAFASGPDVSNVQFGKTVAYAIRVRADLKVGDREFSAEVCLHEVVMLRRFYEDLNGGSVQINPSWPPACQRLIPLTQVQLRRELDRMLENFTIPRSNGVVVIPAMFLGTEPAEQMRRLHTIMQRQLDAWARVVETARKRLVGQQFDNPHLELVAAFDLITARELEEVANLADPARDGIDEIELPEACLPRGGASTPSAAPERTTPTPEDIAAQVAAEDVPDDPQQQLVSDLMGRADLTQQQALSVVALADLMGKDIPDANLIDAIGSKAKSRLEAVRRVLNR